jgi:hypothetical protein
MKRTLFIFGIFLFTLSFAAAIDDLGQIKVVGQFEQPEVSIVVPDQITLPLVANGYSTKNSFEITNDGNTNIGLSFNLNEVEEGNGYNSVFDLLEIGYFDSKSFFISEKEFYIPRPLELGNDVAEGFEIYLDLTNYSITNYSSNEEVYLMVTAYPA